MRLVRKTKINAARGFTLVELMVVVVIIGVMATVVTLSVTDYLVTAKQNVVVPLWPHGVSKAERRQRATDLLTRVGLSERIDTNVKVLSGGERQRVALARALVTNPRLLLADEPTGNLDTKTGHEVMELMHSMRHHVGSALVLVTHNESICEGADRRFRMQDGKLEQTA